VSFFRHVKIYRSDLLRWELDTKYNSRPDHRFDESSTGYSSTGCAPAEPASASPVTHSFSLYGATVHQTAAYANLSLFPLSQQKGALHTVSPFSEKWPSDSRVFRNVRSKGPPARGC
jgi:hypothetical protein